MIYKKDEVVEHPGLEERVREIDKKFIKIETTMERVAENQDKMVASMKQLSDSVVQLVTIQGQIDESFRRVHHRIDEEVQAGKDRHKNNMDKIDLKLNPIQHDVEDLKQARNWTIKSVVGTVITGLIGLLMYIK